MMAQKIEFEQSSTQILWNMKLKSNLTQYWNKISGWNKSTDI